MTFPLLQVTIKMQFWYVVVNSLHCLDTVSRQISVICCEFSFYFPSPASYPLASPTHNGTFAVTAETVFSLRVLTWLCILEAS